MLRAFIFCGSVFLLFSFIHYASKKKKPFKRAFLSMLSGLLAMTAVNLTSGITGVYLPVTELSLAVSTAGGLPATALMVALELF